MTQESPHPVDGGRWRDELAAARAAVLAAGEHLAAARRGGEALRVDRKGRHDYVTQVDRESERILLAALSEACPAIGLLGEEGSRRDLDADLVWCVDPLDGTSNYIHGYPAWSVSVGLLAREERADDGRRRRFPEVLGRRSVLGLVLDCCHGELFVAAEGAGAWREAVDGSAPPRPLRVGGAARLEEAFLATGFPVRNRDAALAYLDLFERIMPPSAGVRRGGSAALDLAYTAAGVFDAFFEMRLSPWDTAAGLCLVREAGGAVAPLFGGDPLADGHLVAGNPALVADLLERIGRERS